ncbi:hypothetical protein [Burkholderia stagnalis]|uniref:hypothetical protein n=1 Tax=Burkholderia stagnalis TaxID=1503054 RepID=UPI000F7FE89F|nr:hypothetical protein [Burkholderia stagnalis]
MSGQAPAEFRSATPARLRRHVPEAADTPPRDLCQLTLEAAAEIEGRAHAFAELVDQKHARQRARAYPIPPRAARATRAQR